MKVYMIHSNNGWYRKAKRTYLGGVWPRDPQDATVWAQKRYAEQVMRKLVKRQRLLGQAELLVEVREFEFNISVGGA